MSSGPPISTVYVQNLEERVKLPLLIESLKSLFSEFGNVVDIVAKNNLKARGQAFIVFDRAEDAEGVIDELQGFHVFGQPMKLSLARTRSDKTVEMKCTSDELDLHKRHRQAEKDKRRAIEANDDQRQARRGAATGPESRLAKTTRQSAFKATAAATTTVIPDEYLPPNRTLFLQNVPIEYDVEALTTVFGRFEGLREIRLVPGRRGIAFVEYEAEQGAITAKENTAGMTLGDRTIKVTYQRQ